LALNAPKFSTKHWNYKRFFSLPKLGVKLWSIKRFFFSSLQSFAPKGKKLLGVPNFGIKLWKAESYMFSTFQTLVPNYGTLSKKKKKTLKDIEENRSTKKSWS